MTETTENHQNTFECQKNILFYKKMQINKNKNTAFKPIVTSIFFLFRYTPT